MKRFAILIALVIFGWLHPVLAQDASDEVVWVQIEAHSNIEEALERAQAFSSVIPDVNGFTLGRGWFGIVLGPYVRADANRVLQVYRSERVIPRDSFIALTTNLGQQYFPPGADVLQTGTFTAEEQPQAVEAPAAPAATVEPEPEPAPEPERPAPDETRQEALRSERALTRAERDQLQIALAWAGYYRGGIDGAFGRGTRGAMQSWQEDNDFEPTGVLTTLQRAALIQQYNAVLDGLGMTLVDDNRAGIQIELPMEIVQLDTYQSPFAQYNGTGKIEGAQVLLISQEGTQNTLFGLYDIMQTLEVVPLDGERSRNSSNFRIVGQNDRIVSETVASLRNGHVKGFTLIWPVGDEERRTRVLERMEASFNRLPGVLESTAGADEVQAIDLVSGLQIRKPRLSRSGFFVDQAGTVVTTAEAVANCGRITIDEDTEADVRNVDAASGVAVLVPRTELAPLAIAQFSTNRPRINSRVTVAGYSFEGVLNAPSLTDGALSDLQGLGGEETVDRLSIKVLPGDAGGPVLNNRGQIVGMVKSKVETARALPEDVTFSADNAALQAVLSAAGVQVETSASETVLDPVDLAAAATGMTVLVSCWD